MAGRQLPGTVQPRAADGGAADGGAAESAAVPTNSAPRADRFGFLASAIAGRRITVGAIYISKVRAAQVLADRLPWAFTERLELRVPPRSESARDSLTVAATPIALPEPPAYFGRILPLAAVRTALGNEGFAALSRRQQAGQLQHLLRHAPGELRRQLAGLGVDQEMHLRQNDGSDLDLGASIECAIELRAGHSPPSLPVYRTSRRTRRDLGVVLVVDISGSTGERPPAGDSVFDKQLKLAYQLAQVFDSLGDTVAMFGFHSWGRKLVRVVRLKGHAERWSLNVAERLALRTGRGVEAALGWRADAIASKVIAQRDDEGARIARDHRIGRRHVDGWESADIVHAIESVLDVRRHRPSGLGVRSLAC